MSPRPAAPPGATNRPWERWLPAPLTRRPLAACLVLAATVLLWNLGAYGLWESTEARYAEIAARMVRSGDWLAPRFNYILHFDKPPLAYWASALGMTLFGVDELGARLPLVLASLAALTVVYRWAAERDGPEAARYAFLCLLSAPLFYTLSRSVATDLYLTLWIVLAVWAGSRAARPAAGRGWVMLAWAAVGLGFMTKGPLILLWLGLPGLAWCAWNGRWDAARRLLDPLAIGVGLAIALPWYAVMAARHPGLVDFWLGRQVGTRVASAYQGEREPWWFYLVTAGWCAGPWIAPALIELVGEWRERGRHRAPFPALLVGLPLVAFSLLPTKRINYWLPAVPALALLAGAWWARAAARPDRAARDVARALAGASAALGLGLLAASRLAHGLPADVRHLGPWLAAFLCLGAVATWRAAARRRLDLAFAGLLLPLLGLYLCLGTVLPHRDVETYLKISRPLIADVARHRLDDEPVVAYRDWLRAYPFYTDRRLITINDEGRVTRFEADSAWRGYVFRGDSVLDRMLAGPRGLFILPRGELDDVERRIGRPLTVVGTSRRLVAVTNRPTAAERTEEARPDR